MYDAFGVRISQRVGNQRDRRQRFRRSRAGKHTDVGPVDELQAVKSALVLVKFERAHDMGVHQANRELPFAAQRVGTDAIVHEDLERDRRAGNTVRRKPGLGRASSA